MSAVVIQGRGDIQHLQWVTSFSLAVSDDGVTFNYVTDFGGLSSSDKEAAVFAGNTDPTTAVETPVSLTTRFVRLYPVTFNRHMSLRWDILACIPTGSYVQNNHQICTVTAPANASL